MKLLRMQMPVNEDVSADANEAEPGTLSYVWSTEGNLARAVHFMHAEQEKATVDKKQEHPPKDVRVLAPQTAFYRRYTEGMLRRYAVLSMESGRVSSLLGREMFRGKVTSYRVHAFDDVVIFVHDIDQCMKTLTPEQQRLILRIGIQQYTLGEMAARLGCSVRSVQRHYAEALDELTAVFLERCLLERIASDPCQEGHQSTRLISHYPQ